MGPPSWVWQGDACFVQYFTPFQIKPCLADMSVAVYGDSLSKEFYHSLAAFAPALVGERLWGPQSDLLPSDASLMPEFSVKTSKVVIITDFHVAHLIREHPLSYITDAVIPKTENSGNKCAWTSRSKEFSTPDMSLVSMGDLHDRRSHAACQLSAGYSFDFHRLGGFELLEPVVVSPRCVLGRSSLPAAQSNVRGGSQSLGDDSRACHLH